MGKDRPLPTPAVSKAGLKVKIQLLISNWERKQSVPSLTSPPPYTHARTLTPPQVHLSLGWGRGRKARAPGSARRARDTADNEHRGWRELGPSPLLAPLPACPSPNPLHASTPAAWPRGPLGLPGGRMRSANAAPVGFLLNCTAAAAVGRRRRSSRGRHRARAHPSRPTAPTRGRSAARSHPPAPPRAHPRQRTLRAPGPAVQDAAQPPYFLLK